MEVRDVYEFIQKQAVRGDSVHEQPAMVSVTTNCPTCKQDWTRDVHDQYPALMLVLEMCHSCEKVNSDEHGNPTMTIVGVNRAWANYLAPEDNDA